VTRIFSTFIIYINSNTSQTRNINVRVRVLLLQLSNDMFSFTYQIVCGSRVLESLEAFSHSNQVFYDTDEISTMVEIILEDFSATV